MTELKTQFTDTTLTAKVKAHFLTDGQVSALAISVKTDKGHVTLSGEVPSSAIAKRAVSIAKSVNGVVNVIDDLIVTDK